MTIIAIGNHIFDVYWEFQMTNICRLFLLQFNSNIEELKRKKRRGKTSRVKYFFTNLNFIALAVRGRLSNANPFLNEMKKRKLGLKCFF